MLRVVRIFLRQVGRVGVLVINVVLYYAVADRVRGATRHALELALARDLEVLVVRVHGAT